MKLDLSKFTRSRWLTCLLLVLASLGVGVLSLCFAMAARRWDMLHSYFIRPLLLFLNLLPPVLMSLFFWFLSGRAAVAYSLTALITYGFTMANWFKLQFRNDPLMFGDLFYAAEAGNMLGRYSLFMTKAIAASLVLLVAGGIFLGFFARGRLPLSWRRFALAAAVVLVCLPVSRLYTSNDIYNNKTQNFDYINRWASTQLYTSKGFIYPFLHSTTTAFDTRPDGYDEAEVTGILAQYTDADIPADKKVDVIGVMLEAFNDFSKYDQIEFAQDPYAEYHALEAESVSGNLVTSIFAGGTVTTERSFLTGLAAMGSFRRLSNSYAWYFAEQGYTVTGSHPSYAWFYNRQNINPNLGFEDYLFLENHYGELAGGGIAKDGVFFPELNRLYDEYKAGNDAPYFSFSVTYQGHGPYSAEVNYWDGDFVTPGLYTAESENILNNYFGSVQSTSRELAAFFDHYRELEDPVVIVVFGDHNPWLGDGSTVYAELGIDLSTDEKQGYMNYYATRYLIWANNAAKEVLGNDFIGEGPDISPNFLMNELFELCGWQGDAYMQYTTELMQSLPVIQTNAVAVTATGELLHAAEGEDAEKIAEFWDVQYYYRTKFTRQSLQAERQAAADQ